MAEAHKGGEGRPAFGFEKLDVWQLAIELAESVYDATRSFPNDERFGLVSQMRRAAVSVSSNIAEGNSRASGVEFGRFLEIAYGSVMELVSQAHIAQRQDMISRERFEKFLVHAERVARMLSRLRNKVTASK